VGRDDVRKGRHRITVLKCRGKDRLLLRKTVRIS